MIHIETLRIRTPGAALVEITGEIADALGSAGAARGCCDGSSCTYMYLQFKVLNC